MAASTPPRPEATGGDALTVRFYEELRAIAQRVFRSERAGHTLQPTAVVNEACMRLLARSPLPEADRADRLALAGRVLQQVLIDHARSHAARKRGGGRVRLDVDPDLCAAPDATVDGEAIGRALALLRDLHERQAEVVTLRLFSGLTMEQVASVLGVSKRTAEDDWTVARAWLRRELARG